MVKFGSSLKFSYCTINSTNMHAAQKTRSRNTRVISASLPDTRADRLVLRIEAATGNTPMNIRMTYNHNTALELRAMLTELNPAFLLIRKVRVSGE